MNEYPKAIKPILESLAKGEQPPAEKAIELRYCEATGLAERDKMEIVGWTDEQMICKKASALEAGDKVQMADRPRSMKPYITVASVEDIGERLEFYAVGRDGFTEECGNIRVRKVRIRDESGKAREERADFPCRVFVGQFPRPIYSEPYWRLTEKGVAALAAFNMPPDTPTTNSGEQPAGAQDDWIPASEAAEMSETFGCPMSLPQISKAAKKRLFRTRKAQSGQHKLEVYRPDFLNHIAKLQAQKQRSESSEMPPLAEMLATYAATREAKEKGRQNLD